MHQRHTIISFLILLSACCGLIIAAGATQAKAAGPNTTTTLGSIYQIPVQPMAGDTHTSATLAPYKGRVMLIVNVASKCGFTPQYEALEKIYRKYKDRGFVVLGFPANDFRGQEPGTEAEIAQFCKLNYGVTFPIFGKIHVIGADKAPLYQHLTGTESPKPGEVKWNFEKFLVGPDGKVCARFPSRVKPDSPEMTAAIEAALATRTAAAARNINQRNIIKFHNEPSMVISFNNSTTVPYDPSNGTVSRSGLGSSHLAYNPFYYNPPFMLNLKNLRKVPYDPTNGTSVGPGILRCAPRRK